MSNFRSLRNTINVFTRTHDYLKRSRQTGADIEHLKSSWAEETLHSLGIEVQISGSACETGPLLMVGNHLSYLDIVLLMLAAPKASFIAKEEIRRWPVFGYGAQTIGTVFVKREDGARRASAKAAIIEELKRGGRVVLFPAGTTCIHESHRWRRGAFEIAKTQQVPIQPFRIRYLPVKPAAFIGQDLFLTHLFRLAKVGKIVAKLEFHPPVNVDDVIRAPDEWRDWARQDMSSGQFFS
jgi:lyso-ornithine lipid O-acyltransferase